MWAPKARNLLPPACASYGETSGRTKSTLFVRPPDYQVNLVRLVARPQEQRRRRRRLWRHADTSQAFSLCSSPLACLCLPELSGPTNEARDDDDDHEDVDDIHRSICIGCDTMRPSRTVSGAAIDLIAEQASALQLGAREKSII